MRIFTQTEFDIIWKDNAKAIIDRLITEIVDKMEEADMSEQDIVSLFHEKIVEKVHEE